MRRADDPSGLVVKKERREIERERERYCGAFEFFSIRRGKGLLRSGEEGTGDHKEEPAC